MRSIPLLLAVASLLSLALVLGPDGRDARAADEDERDPGPAITALVGLLADVDESTRLDVLRGMEDALRGRKDLGVPAGWPVVYRKLLDADSSEIRERAIRLAMTFGDRRAMADLRSTAADTDADVGDRRRAIAALAGIADPDLPDVLLKLLDEPRVQSSAVRALAVYEDDRIPKAVIDRYGRLDPSAQRDAIATLSSRGAWAVRLLTAIGDDAIPSGDLSAFDARHLANLGDETVTRLLNEVWGNVRPTTAERRRRLDQYRRELDDAALATADLVAGRIVFEKTCAGCHRLFDAGREVGPNLTGSQRSNRDYVLQNLLDPNAIIGRDYRVTILVTDSGRIVSGLVAEETENAIVMRTATETVTVPAAEIEVRKQSGVSMMPEGMLEKLTAQQRRDLLAYLASPRQIPLPTTEETR